jgi:hypothetical protein
LEPAAVDGDAAALSKDCQIFALEVESAKQQQILNSNFSDNWSVDVHRTLTRNGSILREH